MKFYVLQWIALLQLGQLHEITSHNHRGPAATLIRAPWSVMQPTGGSVKTAIRHIHIDGFHRLRFFLMFWTNWTPAVFAAGECYDEMNRAMWVVALNAIMQTTASANGTFAFAPGAFDKLTPPVYERDVSVSILPLL